MQYFFCTFPPKKVLIVVYVYPGSQDWQEKAKWNNRGRDGLLGNSLELWLQFILKRFKARLHSVHKLGFLFSIYLHKIRIILLF